MPVSFCEDLMKLRCWGIACKMPWNDGRLCDGVALHRWQCCRRLKAGCMMISGSSPPHSRPACCTGCGRLAAGLPEGLHRAAAGAAAAWG